MGAGQMPQSFKSGHIVWAQEEQEISAVILRGQKCDMYGLWGGEEG